MNDTKHETKPIASHTPGPWYLEESPFFFTIKAKAAGVSGIASIQAVSPSAKQALANARLIAAAPKLLAYAECEEAKRRSLLPSDQGGTGNGQSYFEVFNRHGWDGRDVYGFLDRLRRAAIAEARGLTA